MHGPCFSLSLPPSLQRQQLPGDNLVAQPPAHVRHVLLAKVKGAVAAQALGKLRRKDAAVGAVGLRGALAVRKVRPACVRRGGMKGRAPA